MSDRDIPQEDIIDADGNDPRTVVTRLTRVHDILIRVNYRLADISDRWVGPGPPEQPAMLTELSAISAECLRANQFAGQLIAWISGGGTGGGSPGGDTGGGSPAGESPTGGPQKEKPGRNDP